jgi:hypothetical protein
MKRCAHCGRETEDDAIYCRECRLAQSKATAPGAAPATARETPGPPPLPVIARSPARGQKGHPVLWTLLGLWIALVLFLGRDLLLHVTPKARFGRCKAAAERGDAKAQHGLAYCYYNGHGVPTNYVEAVKWWRKAAQQNYAPAQNCLARCLQKGRGVRKDDAEAVKWYCRGAESGEPTALNNLAWALATSENPAVRDGSNAVFFAKRAVAATYRKNPNSLDTLAAAYAEAGKFERAVGAEEEAIALVRTEEEMKTAFISRLKLYQAKVPYRAKD